MYLGAYICQEASNEDLMNKNCFLDLELFPSLGLPSLSVSSIQNYVTQNRLFSQLYSVGLHPHRVITLL